MACSAAAQGSIVAMRTHPSTEVSSPSQEKTKDSAISTVCRSPRRVRSKTVKSSSLLQCGRPLRVRRKGSLTPLDGHVLELIRQAAPALRNQA